MGLKTFLQQQGFIADDPKGKSEEQGNTVSSAQQKNAEVIPTYFPFSSGTTATSAATTADPSFVTPLKQTNNLKEQPDPTFIKFFEDELVKANIPGPDYFEFRQLLIKTQQKMAAKGVAAPEVVLQAVLMSFEAQEISTAKLINDALHYKEVVKQKNDDFLKGALAEKNNQLQKRQGVLLAHTDAIKKLQQQIQDLDLQKQRLQDAVNKEQTQLEVDKTLGKEGIEKIEKAETLITVAYNYIQSNIDTDISMLKSV
jgi:hypothetical protein